MIVCLGDSITAGYGVPRSKAWPALLAEKIGCGVVNAGINGDTTGGMLARFQREVAGSGARALCIMGGFNDFALGVDAGTVQANLFALVQQCFALHIRPVLGIPIPIHPPITFPRLTSLCAEKGQAGMEPLRAWVHRLANDFNIAVLDFHGRFQQLSSNDSADSKLYLDGLHPSISGHYAMAGIASELFA